MTLPITKDARKILALALLLILPALLLFAACGGDDEGGSGSDATATRTEEADEPGPTEDEPSPTEEDSGGNGGGGDVDACALLTDAEVEAVLGTPASGSPEEDVGSLDSCRWEPGGLLLVGVSVLKGSKEEVAAFYEFSEETSDAVEGIGEKAQYNDLTKSLEVLVDDETDITVVVVNPDIDEKQAAIDLAEKVIDRLP